MRTPIKTSEHFMSFEQPHEQHMDQNQMDRNQLDQNNQTLIAYKFLLAGRTIILLNNWIPISSKSLDLAFPSSNSK